MKLYKYRPLDNDSIDSLEKSRLFFSNPFSFNDAFEFHNIGFDNQIMKDWVKQFIKDNSQESKFLAFCMREELKKIKNPGLNRVLCMSESCDNQLMWGHYADAHRGICFEFETEKVNGQECIGFEYGGLKNLTDLDPRQDGNYGPRDIAYLPILPIRYLKEPPKFLDYSKSGSQPFTYYKYIKDIKWKYEKEWRIIISKAIMKSDLMTFDRKHLSSIIFGMKASKSDTDMIREQVKEYPREVSLYQIVKNNDSYSLALERV